MDAILRLPARLMRRAGRRALSAPADAATRRAAPPVICYEVDLLPSYDASLYASMRERLSVVDSVLVPPRDGRAFVVPAGHFFRIVCDEGAQVGDLNLWHRGNLAERFYSSKTRQLHASHLTTGDRLWSCMPFLRPIATITHDTLEWYGADADGASVHDVIGSRCDPYTNAMLRGVDYDRCCHSNLVRALAAHEDLPPESAEPHVHDVLNVFMATGFNDRGQYFMKATPARKDDFIEFFAEIPLLGALSACPGGDCGSSHSDDATTCYPLRVDVLAPHADDLAQWAGSPPVSPYSTKHGFRMPQ